MRVRAWLAALVLAVVGASALAQTPAGSAFTYQGVMSEAGVPLNCLVDLRASALQAENLLNQAALEPYTFIRRSYLQRREYLVYDGKPPPPKEDQE